MKQNNKNISKNSHTVLKTQITTDIGMSIQLPSGDWVKTSHTVSSETTGYPTPANYKKLTLRQLKDATEACQEQIELLEKRVNPEC